jgi:hypothetical protein
VAHKAKKPGFCYLAKVQYYETFALFKAAIVGCLAEASGKHKPKLASLLTLNFQTFENESL